MEIYQVTFLEWKEGYGGATRPLMTCVSDLIA